MSVLGRLTPLWLCGILVGWFMRNVFNPPGWIILSVWMAAIIACLYALAARKSVLPAVSSHSLSLIFVTGICVSALNSGKPDVPVEREIQVTGIVDRIWPGNGTARIKLKVYGYYDEGSFGQSVEPVLLLHKTGNTELPAEGTCISVKTRLEYLEPRERTDDFPERLYWAVEGIRKKGWANNLIIPENGKTFRRPIRSGSRAVQIRLSSRLDSSPLNPARAQLIKAMILGQRNDMDPHVRDLFRKTGVSHLLAVSGLHVGLIYLVFVRAFFFLRRSRLIFVAEILAVAAVWAYSFLTGMGPSVQRAAGMISLYSAARISGRKVSPLQILITAFYLQTAFDPFSVFSFGFQLSYLAVSGILVFYRWWSSLCPVGSRFLKVIWNYAGISISAQVFTLPFVLTYFHEFPLYFIPGNLFIVPLGLLVFYSGAFYLLLLGLGINFDLAAVFIDGISWLMLAAAGFVSSLPFSALSFESFSAAHLFGYLFLLFIWLVRYPRGIFRRVTVSLSLMLIFSLIHLLPFI